MYRLMIDLETLGLKPGCVILSIGAVRFDRSGLGRSFYRRISMESCQDAGLTIDAGTLSWWLTQTDESKAELYGKRDLKDVLIEFSSFCNTDEIWANSPAFDCVILRAAYEAVGLDVPWHYSDERCFRTLKGLPQFVSTPKPDIPHHALHDAKRQAESAYKTLNKLY